MYASVGNYKRTNVYKHFWLSWRGTGDNSDAGVSGVPFRFFRFRKRSNSANAGLVRPASGKNRWKNRIFARRQRRKGWRKREIRLRNRCAKWIWRNGNRLAGIFKRTKGRYRRAGSGWGKRWPRRKRWPGRAWSTRWKGRAWWKRWKRRRWNAWKRRREWNWWEKRHRRLLPYSNRHGNRCRGCYLYYRQKRYNHSDSQKWCREKNRWRWRDF